MSSEGMEAPACSTEYQVHTLYGTRCYVVTRWFGLLRVPHEISTLQLHLLSVLRVIRIVFIYIPVYICVLARRRFTADFPN